MTAGRRPGAAASGGISDEELLLRAIMQGTTEIDAMRAAGPPRTYDSAATPLHTLVDRLRETSRIGYVHVRRGADSIVLRRRPTAVG